MENVVDVEYSPSLWSYNSLLLVCLLTTSVNSLACLRDNLRIPVLENKGVELLKKGGAVVFPGFFH
ncbi:unnamed protein product [Acanthoscelides obtectus]|uniref:Uncharacterized protein n=1 Tax=Acanthoscelides obtectus TaxID=200917 RepID=A0A9P0NSE8_ACAOB|nr:unnamed protein product [Acanthoscelides obtectus]CAK1639825.1 hypothetical protein AOBTE_LOCUS11395 [Acanthoscelides obtectus]